MVVARSPRSSAQIDILVNNAGTLDHLGRFPDQRAGALGARPAGQPHRGVQLRAGRLAPHGRTRVGPDREHGCVAGTLGGFGQASYSATKAGLLGLTRTLALEGARYGITCNAIVPGVIGTEAFNMGAPEMNERMVKRTALRRAGEPQEIANAIAFLVFGPRRATSPGSSSTCPAAIELFTVLSLGDRLHAHRRAGGAARPGPRVRRARAAADRRRVGRARRLPARARARGRGARPHLLRAAVRARRRRARRGDVGDRRRGARLGRSGTVGGVRRCGAVRRADRPGRHGGAAGPLPAAPLLA